MSSLLPVRFSLCCLVLSLGACSATPERDLEWLSGSGQVSRSVGADSRAPESVGTFLQLPAGNTPGVSEVRVLHEYRAASGRLCRQVEVPQQGNSIRVMCEREKGNWSFTRALVGSEGNESAVVTVVEHRETGIWGTSSSAVRVASNSSLASRPTVQERLGAGESLWRFAARTTGNALNWELIAELNGIENPDRVIAGSELSVPVHLLSGTR